MHLKHSMFSTQTFLEAISDYLFIPIFLLYYSIILCYRYLLLIVITVLIIFIAIIIINIIFIEYYLLNR